MTPCPAPEVLTRKLLALGQLDEPTISAFRAMVYAACPPEERPMPWRETRDPYRILVSEVMLQQTQVERVRSKFAEFLDRFPNVAALAGADLTDVLDAWQGLGYNRRAIALKRCAEAIIARHGGAFPASIHELETLPGIGPYTARAVAAFAFGQPSPLIETNIRTVFLHCFFHGQDAIHDREIMPLVDATLDRSDPRRWYYALMDYGARLKRLHPNPNRRSRHHVRQSRFEGSNRQLRSRLLREILAHPGITAADLETRFDTSPHPIPDNLARLVAEGFLERDGTGYRVPGATKKG